MGGRIKRKASLDRQAAWRMSRSSSIPFHALQLGIVLVLKPLGNERETAHDTHGERRVGRSLAEMAGSASSARALPTAEQLALVPSSRAPATRNNRWCHAEKPRPLAEAPLAIAGLDQVCSLNGRSLRLRLVVDWTTDRVLIGCCPPKGARDPGRNKAPDTFLAPFLSGRPFTPPNNGTA
jgi:hypothetical protein